MGEVARGRGLALPLIPTGLPGLEFKELDLKCAFHKPSARLGTSQPKTLGFRNKDSL